jgi:hypothetical protein
MLLAVGAAGVIGMQKVAITGGADARRFDVATNIAHEWTQRLQRDSLFWTKPNAADPSSNLSSTTWLNDVTKSACNTSPKYCAPTLPAAGSEGGTSTAFDILGRDRPAGTGDHFFCAQYRMQWISDPANAACKTGVELCATALMRAEIRVFWQRAEYGPIGDCGDAALDPDATPTHYHFLSVVTSIRENARQQ